MNNLDAAILPYSSLIDNVFIHKRADLIKKKADNFVFLCIVILKHILYKPFKLRTYFGI